MSSYISSYITGITKTASYYYHRFSEAKAKELSDKVAGYFEEEARALLEAGVDPNAATRDGKPLLTYTVIEHNDDFIKPLVQYGADIDRKDKSGQTALHHAVIRGTHNAVKQLLDLGADVNAKDESNMTPLHYAARNGEIEKAESLLENGADQEVESSSERTAENLIQFEDKKIKDLFNSYKL